MFFFNFYHFFTLIFYEISRTKTSMFNYLLYIHEKVNNKKVHTRYHKGCQPHTESTRSLPAPQPSSHPRASGNRRNIYFSPGEFHGQFGVNFVIDVRRSLSARVLFRFFDFSIRRRAPIMTPEERQKNMKKMRRKK